MSLRRRLAVAFACAACALAGTAAAADAKVALVIGNATYPGAPLRNPANDANAVAARLKALGFDVALRTNVGLRDMTRAVTQFGQALKPGSVALFYYAGHGMQVRGRNFLIPVDADIQSEASARSESVDLDLVLEQLGPARLSMVILDACRNNPFEGRFRSTRGSGLAQVDAPKGTLLAYATAPGKVASDGEGANGLYTAEFLKAIDTPGAKVEEVFKAVRVNVIKATSGEQIPWESSSLTGDYYFRPALAKAEEPKASRETKAGQAELQARLDAERKAREKDAETLKAEMEKLREEVRRLTVASAAPTPATPTKSDPRTATPAQATEAKPKQATPAPATEARREPSAKATGSKQAPAPPAGTKAEAKVMASAPASTPPRESLRQEWKPRFETLESQRGKLTLSKALAILLGPLSDEQLTEMLSREKELRDMPYNSAYALGVSGKGNIVRAWAWGERSPLFAAETAVQRCGRASRVKCRVVMSDGDFHESEFLEWARNAARRSPAEVRAELLKLKRERR
jgi:uncharacterized caspase-like protein